jgi:hypothetical protein
MPGREPARHVFPAVRRPLSRRRDVTRRQDTRVRKAAAVTGGPARTCTPPARVRARRPRRPPTRSPCRAPSPRRPSTCSRRSSRRRTRRAPPPAWCCAPRRAASSPTRRRRRRSRTWSPGSARRPKWWPCPTRSRRTPSARTAPPATRSSPTRPPPPSWTTRRTTPSPPPSSASYRSRSCRAPEAGSRQPLGLVRRPPPPGRPVRGCRGPGRPRRPRGEPAARSAERGHLREGHHPAQGVRHAVRLLRSGFNGPLTVTVQGKDTAAAAARVGKRLAKTGNGAKVTPAAVNPGGDTAIITVVPRIGPWPTPPRNWSGRSAA